MHLISRYDGHISKQQFQQQCKLEVKIRDALIEKFVTGINALQRKGIDLTLMDKSSG